MVCFKIREDYINVKVIITLEGLNKVKKMEVALWKKRIKLLSQNKINHKNIDFHNS